MSKSFLNQAGLPIGLRNNNPGNLRPTGDTWQGSIGTNGGFLVFKDIGYGLRALGTDLANKMLRGLDTIREIVTVYAPPSENDTEAYITRMERYTGFSDTQILDHDQETLKKLIRGHITVELGDQYTGRISDTDIQEGISLMNNNLLQYFNVSGSGSNTGAIVGVVLVLAVTAWFYWAE